MPEEYEYGDGERGERDDVPDQVDEVWVERALLHGLVYLDGGLQRMAAGVVGARRPGAVPPAGAGGIACTRERTEEEWSHMGKGKAIRGVYAFAI